MSTARTIIKRALQKNGVLVKGQNPDGDEANDALLTMNNMLGGWSNNALNISARVRESFTLSGGVNTYTIGTGQTFDTARPVDIVSAFIRQDGNTDTGLSIINDEQYDTIRSKSTGGLPAFLNYDNAFPVARIRLFPTPSTAYTLHLLSEKPLGTFTLDDDVDYPAGWEEAIIDNLAVKLAPEYGQPVTNDMREQATRGMGMIKLAIARNRPINAYASYGGAYDIRSGYYD